MNRRISKTLGVSAALVLLAVPARAQTANEQSAYAAMIYTPVGGLPPLAPEVAGTESALGLQGRIGHMTRRGGLTLTTLGFGVELPKGRWNLGGTIAYLSATCSELWAGESDCDGDIMIGGHARTTLSSKPIGNGSGAPKRRKGSRTSSEPLLVVGFDGSAGYSPRQGEQAMAIAGSFPTAIALQSGDLRILPFLSPGIGFGRLGHVEYEEDPMPTSHGSVMFLVGGGVGLDFTRAGLGATLGFQRVLKSNGGTTQLGIAMTWRGLSG